MAAQASGHSTHRHSQSTVLDFRALVGVVELLRVITMPTPSALLLRYDAVSWLIYFQMVLFNIAVIAQTWLHSKFIPDCNNTTLVSL